MRHRTFKHFEATRHPRFHRLHRPKHPLHQVATLAAGRNLDEVFAQANRWRPRVVSVATEELAAELSSRLSKAGVTGIEVVHGTQGTVACATLPEVDFVVSAIVGVAGLEATHAAILAGKPVGLANKECMVAAGEILTRAAGEHKVPILPIDSEHNAVHQCLRVGAHAEVKTIWLTASGGPFRELPLASFADITPEQALKHPTWVMGRRITIDSATMLNKGLEVIEACRLFDVSPSQVRVTVHPQSTVHSLVEYVDGSILAQISVTDMRLPILYALAWPERPVSNLTFDLAALRHLDFAPPDFERFPCLRLAFEAAENTALPSMQQTRWPSRHSSKGAFRSWESRVQLKRYSHPRQRSIPPPSLRCSPATAKRVKQLVSC